MFGHGKKWLFFKLARTNFLGQQRCFFFFDRDDHRSRDVFIVNRSMSCRPRRSACTYVSQFACLYKKLACPKQVKHKLFQLSTCRILMKEELRIVSFFACFGHARCYNRIGVFTFASPLTCVARNRVKVATSVELRLEV